MGQTHRFRQGIAWQAPLLLILLFPGGLGSGRGEKDIPVVVTDISGEGYFPAAHRELLAAKKTIDVAMFLMQVYPYSTSSSPTFVLVQDLIAAHERGVHVKVILDHSFRYDAGEKDGWIDPKNSLAAEILSTGGVEVYWVPSGSRLHEKLVIIDGEIVISGSHNWSDAALERNEENGDLIRSAEYARIKLERLARVPVEKAEWRGWEGPVVAVPGRLLMDRGLIPEMLKQSDERAFDLVLLMGSDRSDRSDRSDTPIWVDYEQTAKDLGMDLGMGRTGYRRQITKALRRLERKYRLIEVEVEYGRPARVRWKGGECHGETSIEVPQAFWEDGWSRALSLRGKVAYLICLREDQESRMRPWWSMSWEALAEKYGGTAGTLGEGLRDLEKENLLEIVRSTVAPGQGYDKRRPNRYRLKPLLSPKEIEKRWSELEAFYGTERVREARALAEMIEAGKNQDVVADFAEVIGEYGFEQTRKATGVVARMATDNPCRHIGYVVTLLKDWGGPGR